MKTNAANILTLLDNSNVGFATLVEFNWNSNYYFTDIGYNVTWNGQLYLRDNPLVGSEGLKYSNVVNREAFNFQVSLLDSAMQAEFELGIIHKPIKMRLVFTIDNVPQLGLNDTLLLYDGLVAKADTAINEYEKLGLIECTAPLSSLDAIGTIFTTKDGIKPLNVNDTCFDLVSEGSDETSLKWGKS
jgi:hypothetical protein